MLSHTLTLEYPKLSMVEYEQPILAFRSYRSDATWLSASQNHTPVISSSENTTGIKGNEIVPEPEINLFPNPATDETTLYFTTEGVKIITILDLGGKVIRETHTSSGLTNIDLNDLTEGVYLICIKTNDNVYYKKLIRQL